MGATKSRPPETTDAAEILRRRYFEGKPEMGALLEVERANAEVARRIYDLRTEAGLTQQELARLVGTAPSVISRLEDADYEGHSLSMLRRIAAAVGKRVEIRFVAAPRGASVGRANAGGGKRAVRIKGAEKADASTPKRRTRRGHAPPVGK